MAERLFSTGVFGIRLAVTDASSGAALPFTSAGVSTGQTLRFVNIGASACHVAVGVGAQTATVPTATPAITCLTILPGSDIVFSRGPSNATHFAAICNTGLSTTLDVFVGDGE